MDFNTAEPQQSLDLIQKGTVAKVRMTIKPGGFNDPARDWTGGYATHNTASGAVYLNCEFIILEGRYAKRKIWSLIGLRSLKGDQWNDIGRSFIRAILNSARGFSEKDESPQAVAARNIKSFAELDGIEFIARIDVEKNKATGEERNVIKRAVTKGHKDYPGTCVPETRLPGGSQAASTAAPSYNNALPHWVNK
jgi:hypothetical protein